MKHFKQDLFLITVFTAGWCLMLFSPMWTENKGSDVVIAKSIWGGLCIIYLILKIINIRKKKKNTKKMLHG